MQPLDVYRDRLPRHGFGTNDLRSGLRLLPIEELITRAMVQHNMRHSLGWLVYDVDSPTAMLDWEDRHCPPPNIVALNPENGHGHLFYGLAKAVHNYAGASGKALRYMGAIDLALTDKLGADPGYSKLISKNPINERWLAFFPRIGLYDLEELETWLDLTPYRDRRRRLPAAGLGRNCTLFETLRFWAYRERRKPQAYLSEELFVEGCRWRALAINAEFTPPLPHSEVRATAKSVARWTWRTMSAEGFKAYQRRVSAKAAQSRTEKALDLRERIAAAHRECPTLVQADLAAMFGITQQAVSKHLKEYNASISDKHSGNLLCRPEMSLRRPS